MKSLEEIKEEYAKSVEFNNWQELLTYWGEQNPNVVDSISTDLAKEYALEVAKEALKNASENAEFIAENQFYEDTIKGNVDNVGSYLVFVNKQSILSENNLPKLD